MAKDLTREGVFKTIVVFAFPFLISYFLQTLYGLADLFIVGQFNGADTITAVSVGSQVMHMLTVIIVGLSMGSTVLIGRAVGAKDDEGMGKTVGNTVTLFLVISVAVTVILLLLVKPLVLWMFTPEESIVQTEQYLYICFAGIPFITAYNIIGSIFRGMGDSKSPMYFIAVACVFNILLDYLFVGALGMGAAGAAVATVSAQTLSVIFALISVLKRDMGIRLQKTDFRPQKGVIRDILKIGVPVSLQDTFIQFSFLLIAVIANTRGVEAAAAVGIVEKIICILFLIPSSMLSSVSAIAAQNIGAGYHHRARQTLKYGIGLCMASGCLCALVCQIIPESIVGLFTSDPAVIVYGGQYLAAYGIDCIFAGIHFCFSGFFCAYGMSSISFIHNAISVVFVRVPGSYLASVWFP
ncbi:MAG: MATE family efflux transporter, partial [Firmicutes bacterium]|nr:MATE family efflux transporter [Bacillota bacterium]